MSGHPNNTAPQIVYGVPLVYTGNRWHGAVKYRIGRSRHWIWIPKVYVLPDGTLRGDLAWKMRKWDTRHKVELAREEGTLWPLNHAAPAATPM